MEVEAAAVEAEEVVGGFMFVFLPVPADGCCCTRMRFAAASSARVVIAPILCEAAGDPVLSIPHWRSLSMNT